MNFSITTPFLLAHRIYYPIKPYKVTSGRVPVQSNAGVRTDIQPVNLAQLRITGHVTQSGDVCMLQVLFPGTIDSLNCFFQVADGVLSLGIQDEAMVARFGSLTADCFASGTML